MNTVKNCTAIHFRLYYIDVLEIVILLMTCVPNKTEDLNIHVANMITGINGSKALTKHVSCECNCKFDCRKI